MPKDGRRDLPRGIAPRLRTQGGRRVPDVTPDGTPVYRVRLWDPVLKRRVERTAVGLGAAKELLEEFHRPGSAPAVSRLSMPGSQMWRPGTWSPTALSVTARRVPSRHWRRSGPA